MASPVIPFDVRIVGGSLNTSGLEAFNTVEGLGLITFGFLWPIAGIWAPASGADVPATGWTNCPDCSLNGFY